MSRYGGDRSLIGRTIRTAMNTFTVVGVMPFGVAVGLAMGRVPAWIGSCVDLECVLRQGTRGGSGVTRELQDGTVHGIGQGAHAGASPNSHRAERPRPYAGKTSNKHLHN
jgi:hypothetical protein